jgi:V8-like Glu-specific endopeptidase
MGFFDDELPLNLVDFRKFAPGLADRAHSANDARSAIGSLMRTRAIVFGANKVEAVETLGANRLVEMGIETARKISNDPNIELSSEDELGFEAVVRLIDRPALIVRNDSFPEPPPRWRHMDRPFRKEIEAVIPSVGRIDVAAGDGREMIGTGFVVSSDLVMTNTHVIEKFADPAPDNTSWSIRIGANPTIDFKAEHEIPKRKAFRITEVVTAYDRTDSDRLKSLDLALLRVEPLAFDPPGARLPGPLRLAKSQPAMASTAGDTSARVKDVYLIGYPWTDNDGQTPPQALAAIFGGITKIKRLQPGEYGANFESHIAFSHDSSTLGGNSGSFVIDLASNSVIGLHFRGKYKVNNYALQLWRLQDVSGVKDKGLNFVE